MKPPSANLNVPKWLGLLALCASITAFADSYKLKDIEVDRVFATPTVPGARTGAVYLSMTNRGKTSDRLLGASTPRAKRVELHTMTMAGDVMRMRETASVDVMPGKPVTMQPGSGPHLMLVDIGAPLKAGDRFALTLRFEKSGTVEVQAPVEQPGSSAGMAHRH